MAQDIIFLVPHCIIFSVSFLFFRLSDDLVHPLHDILGQPGQNLQRLHVLVDLLHAAGTRDDRADMFVLRAPGDGKLRQCAIQFFGDGFQFGNLGEMILVRQSVLQPVVAFERTAAVGGDAVLVLARQQARGQRTPGGRAEADIFVSLRRLDKSALQMPFLWSRV